MRKTRFNSDRGFYKRDFKREKGTHRDYKMIKELIKSGILMLRARGNVTKVATGSGTSGDPQICVFWFHLARALVRAGAWGNTGNTGQG